MDKALIKPQVCSHWVNWGRRKVCLKLINNSNCHHLAWKSQGFFLLTLICTYSSLLENKNITGKYFLLWDALHSRTWSPSPSGPEPSMWEGGVDIAAHSLWMVKITNLPCEHFDLIRQRTKELPLFWTSSRPTSSPWWYITPVGRQVNYKLALLGIGGAHHLKALWLWWVVNVCGQWGSSAALLFKLSESLSKETVRCNWYPHLLNTLPH